MARDLHLRGFMEGQDEKRYTGERGQPAASSDARARLMAGWLIFVGLTVAAIWAVLFATGEVARPHPGLGFRLAAEILTALAAIVFGIAGLRRRPPGTRPFGFASLGAVAGVTAVTSSQYLAREEVAIGTGLAAVTAVSVAMVFIGKGLKQGRPYRAGRIQIAYFGLGLSLYVVLSAAEIFARADNWGTAGVHVVAFALLLYAASFVLRPPRGEEAARRGEIGAAARPSGDGAAQRAVP